MVRNKTYISWCIYISRHIYHDQCQSLLSIIQLFPYTSLEIVSLKVYYTLWSRKIVLPPHNNLKINSHTQGEKNFVQQQENIPWPRKRNLVFSNPKISKLHRIIVYCPVFFPKKNILSILAKDYLKKELKTFPVVRYFTWKLELFSHILPVVICPYIPLAVNRMLRFVAYSNMVIYKSKPAPLTYII